MLNTQTLRTAIISGIATLMLLSLVAYAENNQSLTPNSPQQLTNQQIIARTYEGKDSTENATNLQRYLAADVVWTEAAGFPYAGTYIGFENIAKVFKQLETEWQDYRFSVEDYVASGDKVMAYGTYSGTYRATGKAFQARVTHLWTLKNQQIIGFEQFVDSQPVNDAMQADR